VVIVPEGVNVGGDGGAPASMLGGGGGVNIAVATVESVHFIPNVVEMALIVSACVT
jgi:hypothetical protein